MLLIPSALRLVSSPAAPHTVPQLSYFQRGVADYVPKDCLDKYPTVTAYIARFKALPALASHYA